MICPHPRLGEEEGEQGDRVRLAGGEQGMKCKLGKFADKRLTTEDNVDELIDWSSGGKKMEEGKENKAKRHLPLPRTGISP